jgi:hypothetical protein
VRVSEVIFERRHDGYAIGLVKSVEHDGVGVGREVHGGAASQVD